MDDTLLIIELLKRMKAIFCIKLLLSFDIHRTADILAENMPADFLRKNLHRPNVIHNSNLSVSMLIRHQDKINWEKVCQYRISIIDIRRYPHLKWHWDRISMNKNMTEEVIRQNPDIPWDYESMSHNPNITLQFVLENLDKPWDYEALSCHPNISFQDILQHPEVPWNHKGISCNRKVKMTDVLNHPEIKWNSNCLAQHLNIDDVLTHRNILLREGICINSTLREDHILSHPEIHWKYAMLIHNKSISIDFLLSKCPKNELDRLIIFRSLTYSEALKYPQLKGKINKIDHPMIDFFDQKINKFRRRLIFDIQEKFCRIKYSPERFIPKMIEQIEELIQTSSLS